jgi:hypothetical protein
MVKIYQNEELNDVLFEVQALDSWKELCEELGLEKQLDFVKSSESPIPYPYINTSMERIFKTLCPCEVEVSKYDKTPIPLEIIQQLAFSTRDKHFNKYVVWYDDKSPDPFLIGITLKYFGYYKLDNTKVEIKNSAGNYIYFDSKEACVLWCKENNKEYHSVSENTWSSDSKKYLIGRWGDEVKPLNELKALAKEKIIEKYGAELKNILEKTSQAIKLIENNALLYLNGEISEGQLKGNSW